MEAQSTNELGACLWACFLLYCSTIKATRSNKKGTFYLWISTLRLLLSLVGKASNIGNLGNLEHLNGLKLDGDHLGSHPFARNLEKPQKNLLLFALVIFNKL